MNTKYGQLYDPTFNEYISSLINNVWKLLPLKQEGCKTIPSYISRINRELFGLISTIDGQSTKIIKVINLLENAGFEEDFKTYRSDVLRCCNLLDKLKIK